MRSTFIAALAVAAVTSAAATPVSAPAPAPAPPTEQDWRLPDPQNLLVIDTDKGRIIVEMYPAVAPQHVARIRALTRSGAYDGRAFFRVIDNFMDQTGDPLDTGTGGSNLPDLSAEFTFRRGAETPLTVVASAGGVETGFMGVLPVISQAADLGLLTADHRVSAYPVFCPGVAGMARSEAPDSANSQFFLMRAANDRLNQKYTAWGRAIFGLDAIRAIKTGEPVAAPQDRMRTVRLAADMPAAQRPRVRVIDTGGPWFRALAEKARAQNGPATAVCDIDIPSEVK